jgi:predicted transcriptional regulator
MLYLTPDPGVETAEIIDGIPSFAGGIEPPMTKSMTLRLSDELAADLALVARLNGVSAAETARAALSGYLRERLSDDSARARLDDAQKAERQRLARGGA